MIRKARDSAEGYLSDEEFADILNPFTEFISSEIQQHLSDYIAYYISKEYDYDVIWDDSSLETEILESLNDINWVIHKKLYDTNAIKSLLASKYKLKVIQENPIKIEKIQ